MPKRTPLCPNIGLLSFILDKTSETYAVDTPVEFANSAISTSLLGKNSCIGGSKSLMVTGFSFINLNISLKSEI